MSKYTLKEYQTLLAKKEAERIVIIKEADSISQKVGAIDKEIGMIKYKIQQLLTKTPDAGVTEHAMLRYLEHVKGINMDEIKKEILEITGIPADVPYEVKGTIDNQKYKFVMRNKQVITVVKL